MARLWRMMIDPRCTYVVNFRVNYAENNFPVNFVVNFFALAWRLGLARAGRPPERLRFLIRSRR